MLASSRNPAAYLANLKPVLDSATGTRTAWLRALNQMAEDEAVGERSGEATALAIRMREQFNEARRALNGMTAPDTYRDMERALDGWLEALSASCEPLATAAPPITLDQVNAARRKLREAAEQADKFNAERASIITVGGPPPGVAADPAESIGNNKRLIVLTLLGLVLMIVALYFAFGALGTSSSTTPVRGPAGGLIERRIFSRAEILDRLNKEIAARQIAWTNSDVKLVEPDRVVVTGQVNAPTGPVGAEAELQLGVTDAGKPKLTALSIKATGLTLPPGALDALNKRTEEANKTLPEQLAAGQFVRKIYVQKDTVVVEVETVGANATPGTKPAAKP